MPPKKSASARAGLSSARSEPLSDTEQFEPEPTPEASRADGESSIPISNADFRRLMARLEYLENRERERQDTPATPNPDTTPLPSVKEPKLAPPPEFHGKVSEYRNFMAQIALTFALCPRTYPDGRSKVLFVISRLRNRPLDWAREIPGNPLHPYHNDYNAFKTALDNIYLDRNYRELCENRLHNLTVTSSVAAFAAEFQPLVEALDWNESAKCSSFFEKLPDDIKGALAIVGRSDTLDELVNQTVAIDQRLRQARRGARSTVPRSAASSDNASTFNSRPPPRDSDPLRTLNPRSRPQFKPPQTPANFNPNRPPTRLPPPSADPAPQPSQSFGPIGPLTEEEKARRRRNGLCIYCADPKHIRDNCPRRLAHEARINAMHFHSSDPQPEADPEPEPENSYSQALPRSEA